MGRPKRAATQKAEAEAKADTKRSKGGLAVADKLPAFELQTDEENTVTSEELVKDNGIILFAYPKANTKGCTSQAVGLSEKASELAAAGYKVYGISADKPKSQANWRKKENLSFSLLCDPSYEVLAKLGFTKGANRINRSHIVVEKGGKVLDVQYGVTPKNSVKDAVAFCLANKAGSLPGAEAEKKGEEAAEAGEEREQEEEQAEGEKEDAEAADNKQDREEDDKEEHKDEEEIKDDSTAAEAEGKANAMDVDAAAAGGDDQQKEEQKDEDKQEAKQEVAGDAAEALAAVEPADEAPKEEEEEAAAEEQKEKPVSEKAEDKKEDKQADNAEDKPAEDAAADGKPGADTVKAPAAADDKPAEAAAK